jgi:stage II sporulation protein D
MKHVLRLFLALLFFEAKASEQLSHFLKVRLLTQSKIYAVQMKPERGAYNIVCDGKHKFILDPQSNANILVSGDSLLLKILNDTIGVFAHIYFFSENSSPVFTLKPIKPERKPRNYDNNCDFSNVGGQVCIVNHVELENYVAGSVQAEGGSLSPIEYQKIQAVLCRTFAIKNLFRHEEEGFDICDHVHCQAYNSRSVSKSVIAATQSTSGEVVVDANLNLITSAYHSNSGGQTANSEDAWSLSSDYLKSINDSFAIGMPNAKWQKTVSKQYWTNYLNSKLKIDLNDNSTRDLAFNFKQEERKASLDFGLQKLALKDIRNDLHLKSSFFSIYDLGDTLLFKGKGFGHGVGLCQEGAMVMAKKGYNYKKILNFYYSKTKILSISEMNFFKE